jgi:hypothetical protein
LPTDPISVSPDLLTHQYNMYWDLIFVNQVEERLYNRITNKPPPMANSPSRPQSFLDFSILLYQLGHKYLGCLFLSMIRQGLDLHRGFDRRLKSWANMIYKAGLYSYSPTTHLCSVPPPSASSSRCLCPRHRHTTFNITS